MLFTNLLLIIFFFASMSFGAFIALLMRRKHVNQERKERKNENRNSGF